MTNLTDGGLSVIAHDVLKNRWFGKQSSEAYDSLHEAFASALQQVRDAAKKEERERCAKVVEGKEMVGEGYGVLHLGGWNQAIKVAVTAIRQMGGGK